MTKKSAAKRLRVLGLSKHVPIPYQYRAKALSDIANTSTVELDALLKSGKIVDTRIALYIKRELKVRYANTQS